MNRMESMSVRLANGKLRMEKKAKLQPIRSVYMRFLDACLMCGSLCDKELPKKKKKKRRDGEGVKKRSHNIST